MILEHTQLNIYSCWCFLASHFTCFPYHLFFLVCKFRQDLAYHYQMLLTSSVLLVVNISLGHLFLSKVGGLCYLLSKRCYSLIYQRDGEVNGPKISPLRFIPVHNSSLRSVRFCIPNSISLDKSNTFFYLFCVYFCTCHSVLKIKCCGRLGAFDCGSKLPNAISFFVAVPVPPAITPNHGSMNRLLWIHSSRFLRRVSVRTQSFYNTQPANT